MYLELPTGSPLSRRMIANGASIPAAAFASVHSNHSSKTSAWWPWTVMRRQTAGSAAARRRPSACSGASGSRTTSFPSRRWARPSHTPDILAYASRMKTGVPSGTRSKSHSASETSMRMQPCDAE